MAIAAFAFLPAARADDRAFRTQILQAAETCNVAFIRSALSDRRSEMEAPSTSISGIRLIEEAMKTSMYHGHDSVSVMLFEAGAFANVPVRELLVSSIVRGLPKTFGKLLPFVQDLEPTQQIGIGMLEHALKWGRFQMADELIRRGANVEVRHPLEGSLLHAAIARSDLATVEYLLRQGADVRRKDLKDRTAAQHAEAVLDFRKRQLASHHQGIASERGAIRENLRRQLGSEPTDEQVDSIFYRNRRRTDLDLSLQAIQAALATAEQILQFLNGQELKASPFQFLQNLLPRGQDPRLPGQDRKSLFADSPVNGLNVRSANSAKTRI